jgi:hypothetical protein
MKPHAVLLLLLLLLPSPVRTPAAAVPVASAASSAAASDSAGIRRQAMFAVRVHTERSEGWRASPTRPETIAALRDALGRIPGDDWISGHLVGLQVKHGWIEDALAAAERCRATPWWCAELRGFVLHVLGRAEEADSAFVLATRLMPESERCGRRQIGELYGGGYGRRLQRMPCEEREALERRIWWLADPLYVRPGNDRRSEHRARLVAQRLHEESLALSGRTCMAAHRHSLLRLGWPRHWWSHDFPFSPVTVARGYSFLPDLEADRAGLEAIGADAWRFDRTGDDAYDPPYGPFHALDHQLAAFRRAGHAVVAAAADLRATPLAGAGDVLAALVLARGVDDVPLIARDSGAAGVHRFRATIPYEPHLVSLEALHGRLGAARARFGVAPPAREGFGISDALLFEWEDDLPDRLDAVHPRMLGSTRLAAADAVGVYWELYGVEAGEAVRVAIAAEPGRSGLLRRMGTALGLVAPRERLEFAWSEAPPGEEAAGRTLRLDLSQLPPGEYTIRVRVDARGRAAVAERAVEIGR